MKSEIGGLILCSFAAGIGLYAVTDKIWTLFLLPAGGFAFGMYLTFQDIYDTRALAKIFDEEK